MDAHTTDSTLYNVRFVIHRAANVPLADLNTLSCDPYVDSFLSVPAHPDHRDHSLRFRTPTLRQELNPEWNSEWIVGGLPSSGFKLKLRLYDEDPGDHDDGLGEVTITETSLHEGFKRDNVEYSIQKRHGSVRAYALTYVASMLHQANKHGRVYVTIEVIGKSADQNDHRVYTIGPNRWSVHYSPLIGRVTGTKSADVDEEHSNDGPTKTVATFTANKLQLAGPCPSELRHDYVGYRPFITSLFTKSGIKGRILNYLLHRQYSTIYYYNKSTEYGVVSATPHRIALTTHDPSPSSTHEPAPSSPDDANKEDKEKDETFNSRLATRFLEMTQWGEGGRMYTYVITLDAEWRFTETGEEFAIDMLSKHSMHSDVAKTIAFSGEFFVRRVGEGAGEEEKEGGGEKEAEEGEKGAKDGEEEGGKEEREDKHPSKLKSSEKGSSSGKGVKHKLKPRDPKDYELVIDNDSGTYRPKKELLPALQKWLSSPGCLAGLANVITMDGFDESLKNLKKARKEIKSRLAKESGGKPELVQATSSISSSDAEELGLGKLAAHGVRRRRGSVSSSDVDELVAEGRKREKEKEEQADGNGDSKEDNQEKEKTAAKRREDTAPDGVQHGDGDQSK